MIKITDFSKVNLEKGDLIIRKSKNEEDRFFLALNFEIVRLEFDYIQIKGLYSFETNKSYFNIVVFCRDAPFEDEMIILNR